MDVRHTAGNYSTRFRPRVWRGWRISWRRRRVSWGRRSLCRGPFWRRSSWMGWPRLRVAWRLWSWLVWARLVRRTRLVWAWLVRGRLVWRSLLVGLPIPVCLRTLWLVIRKEKRNRGPEILRGEMDPDLRS